VLVSEEIAEGASKSRGNSIKLDRLWTDTRFTSTS